MVMKKIINLPLFINVVLAIVGVSLLVGAVQLFASFCDNADFIANVNNANADVIWAVIVLFFTSMLLIACLTLYVLRYLINNKKLELAGIIVSLATAFLLLVFVVSTIGTICLTLLPFFIYVLIVCGLIDIPALVIYIKDKKSEKKAKNEEQINIEKQEEN